MSDFAVEDIALRIASASTHEEIDEAVKSLRQLSVMRSPFHGYGAKHVACLRMADLRHATIFRARRLHREGVTAW